MSGYIAQAALDAATANRNADNPAFGSLVRNHKSQACFVLIQAGLAKLRNPDGTQAISGSHAL